jgi:hypothetical protein
MAIDLFGFTIGRNGKPTAKSTNGADSKAASFVGPDEYDGTFTVDGGGVFGQYVDFQGGFKSENDLIARYRSMALYPEVDLAIDDITTEAIVHGQDRTIVSIDLDKVDMPVSIKNKMKDEFEGILRLLKFNQRAYEIFRRWYIDSKIYYHIVLDESNKNKGILELRAIDPAKIKKVRNVQKAQESVNGTQVAVVKNVQEFYLYTNLDKQSSFQTAQSGLKIAPDSICYVHSGIIDSGTKRVVGYLQKAIRPLNMLRQTEDATVVYRISRAPERRIFYIDVGNLPKQKAEQYLKDIMNRYQNKLVYDASTGEIKDDRKHMNMLEDYWLPRREGGRGTEIQTLDGGQNLGEMEDVDYFLKKVYRALHVPTSRMDAENGFNMGRSSEISRDELNFFKFIDRLRGRFSELFIQLLRTQCLLKGIMKEEDWTKIVQDIYFDYQKDSYFTELKETEIMRERLEMLQSVEPYIGRFYSDGWVRKNILKQSEKEMEEIAKEMAAEPPPPTEDEV